MNNRRYSNFLAGIGTGLILLSLLVSSAKAAAGDTTRVSLASPIQAHLSAISATWGAPTLVQSNGALPQISINPSDKVFASWTDNNSFSVRRSDDGGQSWGTAVVAALHINEGAVSHSLLAGLGQNVYIAWARNGGVFITRSTNEGLSFGSELRLDVLPGYVQGGKPPDIAQDSSGNLYVVWTECPQPDNNIYIVKSTNSGSSFSTPITVVSNPYTGYCKFTKPSIAIGPNGTIYIVWADIESNSKGNIYLSRSTDGGLTFENKRQVNDIIN